MVDDLLTAIVYADGLASGTETSIHALKAKLQELGWPQVQSKVKLPEP